MPLAPTVGMSGKWGTVKTTGPQQSTSDIPQFSIQSWALTNVGKANQRYAVTNTYGGSTRLPGNEDWQGYFVSVTASPQTLYLMPGGEFGFFGYIGPRNGVFDWTSEGPGAVGMAIVESLQVEYDWESAYPVKMTTNMAGAGQYGFNPTTPVPPDGVLRIEDLMPYENAADYGGLEETPIGKSVYIRWGDASGEAETWNPICVSRATLNITSNNQTFVNSCTQGLVGRRMGVVDWSVALVCSNAEVEGNVEEPPNGWGLVPGDIVEIQLPAEGTYYWQLSYGMVRDLSNFVVDRDTGAIISYTVNIEMCAYDLSYTELGRIYVPGIGTAYWPRPIPASPLSADAAETQRIFKQHEEERKEKRAAGEELRKKTMRRVAAKRSDTVEVKN